MLPGTSVVYLLNAQIILGPLFVTLLFEIYDKSQARMLYTNLKKVFT